MPSEYRRSTSTEVSHSETDGVAVPATVSKRILRRGHPKRVKRAQRLSTEESLSATEEEHVRVGSDEGEIDRPASATMAPNPYVGRNLAISVSSGSTTDDERAVRPSNPKSRRYRRPIIQSDASTDISDKEPDDQTTEGASTTNLFDAASAQTNTSEGRAAAIPDEDHVQVT